MGNVFKKRYWKSALGTVVIAFTASFNVVGQKSDHHLKGKIVPDTIHYISDSLQLKGYIFKPKGKGHFPVIVWNHDSERNPDCNINLASFWVKKGYVFFMPVRRGYSDNSGEYICDAEKQIRRIKATEQVQFRRIYNLHKQENIDVITALKWIKQQSYADSNNVVMAGSGYGGIQVLLTAEKDGQASLGIKGFIPHSPAYEVWNTMWRDSLKQAINVAKRPIFLLLAAKDDTTLCSVIEKKGFPNDYQIFPLKWGHELFYTGNTVFGINIFWYLKNCGVDEKE